MALGAVGYEAHPCRLLHRQRPIGRGQGPVKQGTTGHVQLFHIVWAAHCCAASRPHHHVMSDRLTDRLTSSTRPCTRPAGCYVAPLRVPATCGHCRLLHDSRLPPSRLPLLVPLVRASLVLPPPTAALSQLASCHDDTEGACTAMDVHPCISSLSGPCLGAGEPLGNLPGKQSWPCCHGLAMNSKHDIKPICPRFSRHPFLPPLLLQPLLDTHSSSFFLPFPPSVLVLSLTTSVAL